VLSDVSVGISDDQLGQWFRHASGAYLLTVELGLLLVGGMVVFVQHDEHYLSLRYLGESCVCCAVYTVQSVRGGIHLLGAGEGISLSLY